MSRQLTMTQIQEELQGVIHNLQDLAGRQGMPFRGVVFERLDVAYRDFGVDAWRITIEPAKPQWTPPPTAPDVTIEDSEPEPEA